MFGMGIPELLIILAIVLLLFGPKRIKSLGSDLGSAIKGFRSAVKEDENKPSVESNSNANDKVIEGELNKQKEQTKQDNNV
ncbi:MAG: twin-arginine translocase TatA/TatE family subunit [Pseudomonadales bacterium]|nr:twin-arginine translocase TatA/TatE family subunit [Pseudomonadales bacterium]